MQSYRKGLLREKSNRNPKASRCVLLPFVIMIAIVFLAAGCSGSGRVKPPTADYQAENAYMQMAIDDARDGIYNGDGGPFGSVIVKDGQVIGHGHNRVLANKDSTCHGEMEAIRDAEKSIGSYDLSGCVLYTTGEPCTMCLAASKWANIEHVYYGCTLEDNSSIGFRDETMDEELGGRDNEDDYLSEMDRDACLKLFEEYMNTEHVIY